MDHQQHSFDHQIEQQVQARTADLQAVNAQLQREIAERERIEGELQSHIAFESIIIAISTDFINVPTDQIDAGIQQALHAVSSFASVDRSYIFLFSEDATTMDNVYEWCADGVESMMARMQGVPVDDFGWSNAQLLQREILYIPRVDDLPPEAAAERAEFTYQSIQSLIAVPMVTDERVIGFLGFDSVSREMRWSDESITLLKIVGQILVNALKRKQAEAQLRESQQHLEQRVAERTRQIHALLEVQRVLSSRLEPNAVMQMIAEEARHLIGASFGALFVREDDVLRVAGLAGNHSSRMRVGYRMPLKNSATGLALLSRQPVRIDSLDDPRVNRWAMEDAGIDSVIGVPLLSGDEPLGIISVGNKCAGTFVDDDVRVLELLAPGAAIALSNAHLYARAQEAAALEERQRLARDLHDAVTQTLFSASMIADVLPRLWERQPDQGRQRLEELRQLTRGALAEMRTLLLELRPSALIEADLGDVLRQLADATSGRARLPIAVTVTGAGELPSDVQVACYRIAQEAFNNAVKHARATTVTVDLHRAPGTLSLCVRDDGRGFTPEQGDCGHFGLGIMCERAETVGAQLHIESQPGQGTAITLIWHQNEDESEVLL